MNKTILTDIGVFVAGAALGYGVGYFLTKKKWQKIADEEIESVKSRTAVARKDGYSSPEEAAAELIEAIPADDVDATVALGEAYAEKLVGLGYIAEDEGPADGKLTPIEKAFLEKDAELAEANIFDQPQPTDEELANSEEVLTEEEANRYNANAQPLLPLRNPEKPYAITVDEFMEADDDEFDKVELLYFDGDDTLTDHRDVIVPDLDKYIGHDNLKYFGVGTDGDKNALYVRNDALGVMFEVMRSQKSFAEHLGVQEPPVKNSPKKFREVD